MTSSQLDELKQLPFTNLIQWGDHFSVEHPTIDMQHKVIFDIGFGLYENWHKGVILDVFRPTVDKLATLLQGHFTYEESMLADIGYVDLKAHVAEHQKMLDEMQMIRERFNICKDVHTVRGGSVLVPGWPVIRLLLGFTIGHVATSDKSYFQVQKASRGGRLAAQESVG